MPFRRSPGRPRKGEPPAPSRVVFVKIPLDLLEALEAIASSRRMSRHQAIREALARYVAASPASAQREHLEAIDTNKGLTTRQGGVRNAMDPTSESPES